MNDFRLYDNEPYRFDVDKNGFPCFTPKNIKLITAVINLDSTYRVAFDESNTSSSANFLKNRFPESKKDLEKAIRLIDKENSTHLIVSRNDKKKDAKHDTNKQGIIITVNSMMNEGLEDLGNSIKEGKKEIVLKIANYVKGRFNISFASKFCAYCNRYCFGKDDYSIYDSVLASILPYYAYVYLGEEHWKSIRGKNARKESNIANEFADKNGNKDYAGYNDLIERIIDKVKSIPKFDSNLTKKDFDLLLWYYFKGDNTKIIEANQCLGDSTKSLLLGNE